MSGALFGTISALFHIRAERYLDYGLDTLVWITLLCELRPWVLVGLAAGTLSHLGFVAWATVSRDRAFGGDARGALIPGLFVAGLVVVLALVALAAGVRLVSPTPGDDSPNVILITIDTLRYDHMSLYGYERDTTPNIAAFAREGVVFTQATTPRPKTTPSMVSMLTGLYPHRSGARLLVDPLKPGQVTLAELLRNAGYRTGAIVSNYVLRGKASGLRRGFDHYDDHTPEFHGTQRDAAPTTERAIAWLRRNVDRRVFLWVHYMDPHGPYTSPPPFREAFRTVAGQARNVPLDKIPSASRLGNVTNVDLYINQYDSEIRYTDHHVGRLLDALSQLGLGSDTIVILTADHGESLGDHDYYFEHGRYVYDASARIPLIVRIPSSPHGLRIDSPVEIVDVFPTLLELIGLESPVGVDGASLLPLLRGQRASPRLAYIERSTMIKAVRTPDWKLIHTYDTDGSISRRELYDLNSDPGETRNLHAEKPGQRQLLEPALLAWTEQDPLMKSHPGEEVEGANVPDDVAEKLRVLGYLE